MTRRPPIHHLTAVFHGFLSTAVVGALADTVRSTTGVALRSKSEEAPL